MAKETHKRQTTVQAIKSRGRRRPPAPQAAETADGKPPGVQSVKRHKA